MIEITVLIYNIEYHADDGSKIIKNYPIFQKNHPEYKYIIGESGSYGNIQVYEIPNKTITIFKKDIKKFYKNLKIKKLKIKISKEIEDKNILLLDKKPV